jgi:hypothetical protein
MRITDVMGGGIHTNGIVNIFNKIIAEKFPSIEKEMPFR